MGEEGSGLSDFINADLDAAFGYKLTVNLAEKALAIDVTASDRGSITLSNNKADVGDTVSITLTPNEGYRTTDNSVSVTVTKPGQGGAAGTSETTKATRGADGKYSFTVPTGATGLSVAAEFMIGDEASNTKGDSASVGVAVTLAVTTHKNYAAIARGTIITDSLHIAARSGNAGNTVTSRAASYAGYTNADVGVGGAVSVHVAVAKTKALVHDTATLVFTGDNSGDISIEAISHENFTTVADAAGKVGKGATAGVGAGIAVAVFGTDVIAAVLDGTPIYHNTVASADEVSLGSIEISADHTLKETTDAKAGSAGGISATPVLAVHVSGADVQAYLGKAPNGNTSLLSLPGAAKLTATNRANRQIAANAAAAGANVGIGGSFAVSLANDSAIARVNRSLRAKSVQAEARSKSILKSTSRAGANGTPSSGTGQKKPGTAASSDASKSEADGQADGALGAAGKLSASVDSNNCNGSVIGTKSANRQKSQSTEGSVQVAAAFVLNIQINVSRAFIGGESPEGGLISVVAADGVTIETYNRTDSNISANASATKAQYGVGVAVAINVVTYINEAFLGRATAEAGSLTVRADVWEEKTAAEKAEAKQDKAEEQNFITRILRELIDEAIAAIGIEELFENEDGSENAIAKLIDDLTTALGKVAEDLVAGTGLAEIMQGEDPITKITNNIQSFLMALQEIPDTLKSGLSELFAKMGVQEGADFASFAAVFKQRMGDALMGALPDLGSKLVTDVGNIILDIIKENLLSVVSNMGAKPPTQGVTVLDANGTPVGDTTTSVSNVIANTIKTQLIPGLKNSLLTAMGTVLTELARQYLPDSINVDTVLRAPMQEKLTALLEGPTNIIREYADILTDGLVDIEQLTAFLQKGNIGLALQQNLKSALSNLGKALTNAAIDALTTVLDVKLAAEEVNERQHTIVTTAVSGAGATDVGVAGSLALAVVVGTTRANALALDAMQNSDIVVTGDVLIEAYSMQNEDTTATSAISRDGTPNKNLGAGKGTDTTTPERRTVAVDGDETDPTNAFAEISLSPLGGSATAARDADNADVVNVTLKPDEGYIIDTAVPITLRYTKLVGTTESEETATASVTKNADGTYAFSISKAVATDLKDGTKIVAVVDFQENLKNVVTLLSKRDSEAESAPTPLRDELTITAPKQAKWGDTVQVTVKNLAGYRLDKVEYWYTAKGKTESEPHKALTVKDSSAAVLNADVYLFYMPDVTDANDAGVSVAAYYTKLAETTGSSTPAASTQQKQDSGSSKSVGVGAAFALTVGTMEVTATVGKNRRVDAATLSVTADGAHNGETVSVSGVDPIKGATEQPAATTGGTGSGTGGTAGKTSTTTKAATKLKDIAVDASAAVSLIYNDILAQIAENVVVTLTGASTILVTETNADGEASDVDTGYQMIVRAAQQGETLTKASGFSAGNSTAVGAAVSVNIPLSTVQADFFGRANLPGKALITATTFDADDSEGIATAVGADIDRMLQKYGSGVSTTEENANRLLSGDMFTEGPVSYGSNKNNKTASTVNGGLNGQQEKDGSAANNDTNLSSNALRTTNVQASGTNKEEGTVSAGVTKANDNTGKSVTTNSNANSQDKSYQVAAAVGVNITVHHALVNINGSITSGALKVLADNKGNFRTLGTGVGMSLADNSNAIAVGVAMSINNNRAIVTIANNAVIITADDADFTAQLTQNQDGDYKGYLGAQALSGAVSGKDGAVSIGAAIATIISHSKTEVCVLNGTAATHAAFTVGGKLTIEAIDKSKLALRAGGISVSKGASMGLGASFAVIIAYNAVKASVGDYTRIRANEFTMLAQKQRVDIHDYKSAFGLSDLISDSSNLTDAERQDADTGIIDVHKGADQESYKVDINLSTDTVLELIDLANFLSSTNYYAEAIAGSVITETNSDGGSVAGAFTMVLFHNTVDAAIGNDVDIVVIDDMSLLADNSANVRIIAGSLAAGGGTGVGLNFGLFLNVDMVNAMVGTDAVIQAGSYAQEAITSADVLVITIASAIIASSSSSAAIGGALNVLSANNWTFSTVGDNSRITATTGDIDITAANDILLIFVSASVSVSASGSGVAVGGTVGVAANTARSCVDIKPYVELVSENGSVHLDASATEWLIHLISSISGAAQGTSVAAVLGVLGSYSDIQVYIGNDAVIRAKGDVIAKASGTAVSVFGALGVSVSSAQVAVGATVMLDAFVRNIGVTTGANVQITAGGDVLLATSAQDIAVLIAISASGSSSNVAVSGTIPFMLASNIVQATTGADNTIHADGSIAVSAYMRDVVVDTAGGIAISGGNTAVGATVTTGLFVNIVTAKVGQGNVLYAKGLTAGLAVANRREKRRGVIVSAVANETIIMVAVSGAATGGSVGVAGVISTFAARNRIEASIESGGKTIAGLALSDPNEPPQTPESANAIKCSESDVIVEADDNTVIVNVAGGLSGASSTGVGATVAVVAFVKTINAFANGEIYAARDIIVSAYTSDNLWLLAIAFGAGGSTGVAGDLNTMLFYNSVEAYLSGTAVAGQNISVKAENKSVLVNVGAGVGAAGSTGVVAIALVTFFYSETKAAISAGTAHAGGNISIQARSFEVVTADAAGVGAGGATGVGGVLDVILTKVVTRAYVGEGVKLYAGNNIDVNAFDQYILAAVLLNVAGAAEVGVSVSILATVSFNTVCAEIYKNAELTAGGAITVEAISNRDAHSFVSTVGGGGTAGVTVSVSVMAVGSRLSEDAHDAIYSSGDEQVTHSSNGTEYFVYEDEITGDLYYKTAGGEWYSLVYVMTETTDTVEGAEETGYVFEDDTGVYRAYTAKGKLYYTQDQITWFQKTECMTPLDDVDESNLEEYYNRTMDPQAQSDAAFAQGNQTALDIGDKKQKLAGGSLTQALMGEKDGGKNAAAIGADFDKFGQQSDDTAKKVIREESHETADGEIADAYAYKNGSETIFKIYKIHKSTGKDVSVESDKFYKIDDGKFVEYTGSIEGYEPDYVIATVIDNRYENDDIYEIYKTSGDDDGTRYYKRDGLFYRRVGQNFVADDTIDAAALVPVYMVRTVGEDDIKDGGDIGEMNEKNYDKKAEQVQVNSDDFEPLAEALSDGTGAVVRTGAKLTTTNTMGFGDINVLASDLMISNLISGGLAIGAAGAGVGVGISVMVLFSDVEAVVEDGAALSAADNVNIIASSGKPATAPDSNADVETKTIEEVTYYHFKNAAGSSYYYNPVNGKLYQIDAGNVVTSVPDDENARLKAEGMTAQRKQDDTGAVTPPSGSEGEEYQSKIDTETIDEVTYYHYKDKDGHDYYFNSSDGKLYTINGSKATFVGEDENTRLKAEGLTPQMSSEADSRGVDALFVIELVADKLGFRQDNSIFMVGVTGSGGALAGVSVTLGALFVFSKVNAELLGDVIRAKDVNVDAIMDFGNVVTATAGIAVSAGASVTVSAGFTFFMGEITAAIRGNADVKATGTVSVTSGGETKSSAAAAGVAGSVVGVSVNIALAVNTTLINTYIAQGVTVRAQKVLVQSDFDTYGAAYLMTATIGGVAVGVGVAFVLGVAISNVYIGKLGSDASDEAERGTIYADTITVTNDLSTDMYVAGMGLSVGAVAVDVIVALAINYTEASAFINRMHMQAEDILVRSSLHGGTEVVTTSLTAGGVAVGVSVALAFLRTKNDAFVDVTNSRIQANNLCVYAGDSSHPADSVALVTLVAGVGGLISVGVNFGIAINASANKAAILGHVDPGALTVTGDMRSEAVSRARAFSISANVVWAAIGVNPSIAFALLISQQDACIELTGAPVTVGRVDVISNQNTGFDTNIFDKFGDSTIQGTGAPNDPSVTFTSMAEVFILSGAGGLLSVTPNIALALAAATGDARLSAPALTVTGQLNVHSFGSAVANVNIDNLPGAALAVGVMVGIATAGGEFTATLTSKGSIRAGSIDVKTTYRGAADTVVIPTSAGMSVSLCTENVNTANSMVITLASACITGANRACTVTADGAANVTVNGSVRAYATVGTPYFTIAAVFTAINEAGAEAAAKQTAEITGVTLHAGTVNIASNLNKNGAADEGAFAELGKNSNILTQVLDADGSAPTVELMAALLARNDNIALANNICISTAAIYNANVYVVDALSVLVDGVTHANANVTVAAVVGLMYIGLTTTFAYADGIFQAYIDDAEIIAGTVSVSNMYEALANAETMQPNGGVGFQFAAASVTTNTAAAVVHVVADSLLRAGANITTGTLHVSVNGLATAFAGKISAVATLAALEIAASMFTATNKATQNAGIDGATIKANAIFVTAFFNNSDGRKAAEARLAVPKHAAEAALIGVGINTALANAITESHAWMRGVTILGGPALTVKSIGSSVAEAKIGQSDTSLGLFAVGLATLEACADGEFTAYIDTNCYDANNIVIGTVDMQASNVTVATDVTIAKATAVVGAPEGGIPGGMDITLYKVKTNTAVAIVEAQSLAYITGGGSVTATGNISVTANTRALAEASSVKKQGAGTVSIAANVLTATVGSVQKAYIAGTKVSGASITVRAQYNDNGGTQPGGAISILDGNGTSLALYGTAVNAATATDNAETHAYIEYAGITEPSGGFDLVTAGTLCIESIGNAYAEAKTMQGSTMGALMMGVTVVAANANGTFYAGERIGNHRRIKAGKHDVRTTYTARASATTEQSGVKETGASAETNAAAASVGTGATAEIAGDGDGSGEAEADADDDGIAVTVDGTANAIAGVYKAISISLENAAMNALTATVAATQTAQIQDVTITGADAVKVQSFFNVDSTDAAAGTLTATGGAYTYMNAGGSAAGVSITGNMAKAEITAEATAQIVNASIGSDTRRGRILVHSYGASVARAEFGSEAAAAFVGAGCNLMTANSNAKFTAKIDTNGAIYAESADIFTHYVTESYAVTSDGSLSVGGITAKVNSATAAADSVAGAYLVGNGRMHTSGVLDGTDFGVRVRSKGDARAEALYSKAGLSGSIAEIATTKLLAKLTAKQYAEADLASLVTNGKDVAISAEYNVARTKADPSAQAYIVGADAEVTLVGAEAHNVTATDNSLVTARYNARPDAANVNSSMGALTVTADGRSFALAGHKAGPGAVAAGIATVGAILTYANACASFNAYAGADAGAVADMASLTVLTTYLIKAYAETGMPTYGIDVLSAKINRAEATVGPNGDAFNASAGVYGGNGVGTLRIHGALNVRTARDTASDLIDAYAVITNSTMRISGATMGGNVATARLNSRLRAIIADTILILDGAASPVTVRSTYGNNSARISSKASVGMAVTTGSEISLSVVSGAVNTATAYSSVTNTAAIERATILTDSAVAVEAETWSLARADSNESFTITGIAHGSLSAASYACDHTTAHITGAKVEAASVKIRAYGDTKSESNVGLPAGAAIVDISSASACAYVGNSDGSERNTVHAYAGSGTTLIALGNVSILAENRGSTEAKAESQGKRMDAVRVSEAKLCGNAYLLTEARVDENAAIISGGDVDIYAKDYIYQKEHVGGSENIGILGAASFTYASNIADTIVRAVVEGSITAAHNVYVHTDSDAYQYSKTGETGRAIFCEDGNLTALNMLTRDVDIKIGGDARLSADYGYIRILAQSGVSDQIYVTAAAESAAAFGSKDGMVTNTYVGSTDIEICAGAVLYNRFGDIDIKTAAGHNYNRAELDMRADGVTGAGYSDAIVNVTIDSGIQVGGQGNAKAVAIEGRNVTILAGMGRQRISAFAKAQVNGSVTVDGYATSAARVYLTATVNVNNASVIAYDDMHIESNTTPLNKTVNISSIARARIDGTINGNVEGKAYIFGSGVSIVNINGGARLYGYHVELLKTKYGGSFTVEAEIESHGVWKVDSYKEQLNYFNGNGAGSGLSIDAGSQIYIGRSVSGMYVEIGEDLTVRAVGVDNVGDEADGTQHVSLDSVKRTLTIPAIQTGGPGSLLITNTIGSLPANVVRYTSYTPFVDILNKSDYHIILGGVDVYDENAANLTVNNWKYAAANAYSYPAPAPHVSVTSEQGTDVTVNGLIANETGKVTFEWLHEPGNLYVVQPVAFSGVLVAPLWAHALSVINAKAVDVEAYMSNTGGDPAVSIAASGDIRAELTLSEVGVVSAIPSSPDGSPVTGALDTEHIVSTAGSVDITFPEALRFTYTADGVGYIAVVPGVFTLSSETVESEGDATISLAGMANLLTSETGTTKAYSLPNGTTIYLTDDRISRIETKDGKAFDVAGIAYDAEHQMLTIEPGVTLDLTTGVLSVAGDYVGSFTAYIDYDADDGYGLDTQPTVQNVADVLQSGMFDTNALELWYTDNSGNERYYWPSEDNHKYVVKMTKGEDGVYSIASVMAAEERSISLTEKVGETGQWDVSLGDHNAVIQVTLDADSGNYTTSIFVGATEYAVTVDLAENVYRLKDPKDAPAWLRGMELMYQVQIGDKPSLQNVRCKQIGAALTALAYTYEGKTYTVTPKDEGTQQQCATITLQGGDSIKLKQVNASGYRIGETLHASGGAVITDGVSGVQYDAAHGTASKAGEFITSASGGELTEVMLPLGQDMSLIMLSDEVSRGFDGTFYKHDGNTFTSLTSAETADGTTVSDAGTTMLTIREEDGVTAHDVYKNGKLAFTVYGDGRIVHAGTSAAQRTVIADNASAYHLGEIAGDEVTITMLGTAGSIENTETEADVVNITAEGDLTVIMQSTGQFGSKANPVTLSVGGELIFKEPGGTDNTVAIDTNIKDASGEGLTLASGTTILGEMNMQSAGTIAVTDVTIGDNGTAGSLKLSGDGGVTASDVDLQNGDLTLESEGDIAVDGLDASNKPSNLTITGNGDVTVENSDMRSVQALAVKGDNVSITDNTGDVHIGSIDAAGALTIETTGDVTDASGNTDAALALVNAQAQVDDLLIDLDAAEAALQEAEEEKRKADEAFTALQEQYDNAADDQKPLLADALAAARASAEEAARKVTQKQQARDAIQGALTLAQQDLANLSPALPATISADSVTIQAGGSVGAAGAPLIIESTGALGIASDVGANLFVAGDAEIDHIDAPDVCTSLPISPFPLSER